MSGLLLDEDLEMTSIVWGRDPQDAYDEPYEYDAQEQFVREARALLRRLYVQLNSDRHSYTVEDTSRQKAVWLLVMDALDALRDCLTALIRKEHRVAGRLFRDVTETMDLAVFFHSGDAKSDGALKRWYADEIVQHSQYRDFVERTRGEVEKKHLAEHYSKLSRFTHRSYRTILHGYVRGRENRLGHDRSHQLSRATDDESILVLPQTISMYYAVLASIIIEFTSELPELDLVTPEDVGEAFDNSLELSSAPRRFVPRKWLADRMREQMRTQGDRPS